MKSRKENTSSALKRTHFSGCCSRPTLLASTRRHAKSAKTKRSVHSSFLLTRSRTKKSDLWARMSGVLFAVNQRKVGALDAIPSAIAAQVRCFGFMLYLAQTDYRLRLPEGGLEQTQINVSSTRQGNVDKDEIRELSPRLSPRYARLEKASWLECRTNSSRTGTVHRQDDVDSTPRWPV